MELGEKLRNARQKAGLSQRQLCEGIVTRNMLSQIENGSAKPSMKTLLLLAERLGKNVSFFLEETAVLSPNQNRMRRARECFDAGNYAGAIGELAQYLAPDEIFDREYLLLWSLSHMALAKEQITMGKIPYARDLLEKARVEGTYCSDALERQRLLLLGQLGEQVSEELPSLDEELMLRAAQAQSAQRSEALLETVENRDSRWQYLRGKIHFAKKEYSRAVPCLHEAEKEYPGAVAPLLEVCYRELGDFKQAYFYACRQK